jgi:uncharacterized protein YukE
MQAIATNTQGVRSGAEEITQASDDLSRRTEQQAASMEETAAALDQITATVRRTAEVAHEARDLVSTSLGLPSVPANATSVVIEDGERVIGLLADAVSDIITESAEMRQVPPETGSAASREYVEGLLMRDQKIVSVLSIPAVMPKDTASKWRSKACCFTRDLTFPHHSFMPRMWHSFPAVATSRLSQIRKGRTK